MKPVNTVELLRDSYISRTCTDEQGLKRIVFQERTERAKAWRAYILCEYLDGAWWRVIAHTAGKDSMLDSFERTEVWTRGNPLAIIETANTYTSRNAVFCIHDGLGTDPTLLAKLEVDWAF